MTKIDKVITTISKQGTKPLRFSQEKVSIKILRALYQIGINAIECTHRGIEAKGNFKKLIAVRETEIFDLLIGIGTIKNEVETETYLELGADFFISPNFVPEVAALLKSKEVLYIAGCTTTSQIITTEHTGIQFMKLFSANKIQPDLLESMKNIFPNLIFMTGGIDTNKEIIQDWYDARVTTIRKNLTSKKLMDEQDFETTLTQTKSVLNIIQIIK